jgi:hypothetical protein
LHNIENTRLQQERESESLSLRHKRINNLQVFKCRLVGSSAVSVAVASLQAWTECKNKTYFSKVIRNLHKARLIEASEAGTVRLLPPGTTEASRIISNHKKR